MNPEPGACLNTVAHRTGRADELESWTLHQVASGHQRAAALARGGRDAPAPSDSAAPTGRAGTGRASTGRASSTPGSTSTGGSARAAVDIQPAVAVLCAADRLVSLVPVFAVTGREARREGEQEQAPRAVATKQPPPTRCLSEVWLCTRHHAILTNTGLASSSVQIPGEPAGTAASAGSRLVGGGGGGELRDPCRRLPATLANRARRRS